VVILTAASTATLLNNLNTDDATSSVLSNPINPHTERTPDSKIHCCDRHWKGNIIDTLQWLQKTSFHYHWPQFAHIYLELSNVLRIRETGDSMIFDMEFALLPEHRDAVVIAGERYTFRHGDITFYGIRSHSWREKEAKFFTSEQARTNTGIIMYLGHDPDGYLIYGDFGYLRMACDSVNVRIDNTTTESSVSASVKI